jgi:hypothetical protein
MLPGVIVVLLFSLWMFLFVTRQRQDDGSYALSAI